MESRHELLEQSEDRSRGRGVAPHGQVVTERGRRGQGGQGGEWQGSSQRWLPQFISLGGAREEGREGGSEGGRE